MSNIRKLVEKMNKVWLMKGIVFLQIAPIIIAGLYMFPAVDDFSNANRVQATGISNLFINALHITQNVYETWQGTYFSCFLLYFISPLTRGGVVATRIACVMAIIFLVSGVFYLCRIFVKDMIKEEKQDIFWFVYAITLFLFTLGSYVDEAFYWFTGTYVYTVPMACSIWGIAFLMKYRLYGKWNNLCISLCFIFAAVGGALQITTLTCGILLGIILFDLKNIKRHLHTVVAFLVALVGGLANVLAPGYYIRHDKSNGEFQVMEAILFSIKSVGRALELLIHSFPCLLIIFSLIGIGYFWGKKKKLDISFKQFISMALYLFIGVIVVDFPVYMGYGDYFPGRCLFIENIAVSVTVIVLSIVLGSCLNAYEDFFKAKKKIWAVLMGGLILLNVVRCDVILINYPSLNIWRHLLNGNISEYVETSEELFQQLEAGEGKDIVISNLPNCMDIFYGIGLNANEDFWTNRAIAGYYSINSIRME